MRALLLGALAILALTGVALARTTPKDREIIAKSKIISKKAGNCPRDCICEPSSRSRTAKCNRLEVGTQIFGEDISDLVIDGSKVPIVLGDNVFKKLGLTRVINLKITQSVVTSISPSAFGGLNDLYSVNLTANNIERIDPKTFADNPELNLLSLSGNPLKMNPRFLKSASLQELDVSNCGIENVPTEAFDDLQSLMYINLSRNKLQKLEPDVFAKLASLEEIDLSNNRLKDIPSTLFANNKEMSSLYLGGNPINSVQNLTIGELLALNIENASIKVLKNSTFTGLPFLTTLILTGNGIEEIEPSAFATLGDLNYLDLSNNNLKTISDKILRDSGYLDIFKIANNTMLKALPANGFFVDDYDFNIYLFDASGCSIEVISNNTFENMRSLTQINLSRNKITSVGSAFSKTVQLVELDLSHNKIEILEKSTFIKNKDLTKLNLAGNPLVLINLEYFSNNPSLSWLDISNCQLYKLWEIERNASSILPKLHYLNASHNQISNIHSEDIQNLSELKTLDISSNPMQCNIVFERLMKWLGDHGISPVVQETMMSNMNKNAKMIDGLKSWEFLAKDVCGKKPETKDKEDLTDDGEGDNDDDDTDDADIDEDDDDDDDEDEEDQEDEDALKKIDENPVKDANGDYIVEDSDSDDYYEDDYDSNDSSKEPIKKPEGKSKLKKANATNKTINEIIIKESPKRVEIKFDDVEKKLNDGILFKDTEDMATLDEDEKVVSDDIDKIERILSVESILMSKTKTVESGTFGDSWGMSDSILRILAGAMTCVLVILVIILFLLRNRNARKRLPVVIVSSSNKMKKDCGLVYQQLTEDLAGPRTPVLNKHHLISNITSESNPFQNTKVIPENV